MKLTRTVRAASAVVIATGLVLGTTVAANASPLTTGNDGLTSPSTSTLGLNIDNDTSGDQFLFTGVTGSLPAPQESEIGPGDHSNLELPVKTGATGTVSYEVYNVYGMDIGTVDVQFSLVGSHGVSVPRVTVLKAPTELGSRLASGSTENLHFTDAA